MKFHFKQYFTPEFLTEAVVKLGSGVLIFLVLWVIAIVAQKILLKFGNKLSDDKQFIIDLLASLLKTVITVIAIITAVGSLGVNVSALVAGLGITGFALSFAVKDSLSNILSGMLIIFYKPFKIGQYVKISNLTGKVASIDLRYTTLVADNYKVLVPNTLVFSKEVVVSDQEL